MQESLVLRVSGGFSSNSWTKEALLSSATITAIPTNSVRLVDACDEPNCSMDSRVYFDSSLACVMRVAALNALLDELIPSVESDERSCSPQQSRTVADCFDVAAVHMSGGFSH